MLSITPSASFLACSTARAVTSCGKCQSSLLLCSMPRAAPVAASHNCRSPTPTHVVNQTRVF
jgi:hypothetical protein